MQRIGEYELLEELARGGMGVVFRARDTRSDTEVAIKVNLNSGDARGSKRFYTEAKVLTRLRHPNLVSALAAGQDPRGEYLVMEFVRGGTVQEVIDDTGPLAPRRAAEITLAIAEALAHTHAHGVLHRDLKPANVLITEAGTPMLTDFGLAKDLGASLAKVSAATREGAFLGTPGFLAPEQARGKLNAIGPRSDVYGLGATLYAMLTGEPPFKGESLLEIIVSMQSRPRTPRARRREVDAALSELCMRCLAPEPEQRPASAQVLAESLKDYLYSQSSTTVIPKRRVPPALTAALGIATVVVGAGLVLRSSADPKTADSPANEPPEPIDASAPPEGEGRPGSGASEAAVTGVDSESPERQFKLLVRRASDRMAVGRDQEAIEDLREALALEPKNKALWGLCGQLYGRNELGRDAVAAYTKALEIDSTLDLIRYNRGVEYQKLADYERARDDYQRVVNAVPDFHLAWRGLGVCFDKLGQPERALAALDEALELVPDLASLWEDRGLTSVKLDPIRGRKDFDTSIELDPNRATTYFHRALLLEEQEDDAAALADYDRAVELSPTLFDALYNRALLRERTRDLKGALEDYDRAIESNPKSAMAWVNRGSIHRRQEANEKALADFTTAIEVDPSYLNGWIARAQLRFAQKDYVGAEEDFSQAMQRTTMPILQVNRGLARMRLDDKAGARADFDHVLATTPSTDPQAKRARDLIKILDTREQKRREAKEKKDREKETNER